MDEFRDVFWSLPDQGIAVMDRDGTITAWNPAAAAITGCPETDAIGSDLQWLHTPAAPCERSVASLEDARSRRVVAASSWRPGPHGRRFWCDAKLFAVRDAGGELVGFAESFVDASAEHERGVQLRLRDTALDAILDSGAIVMSSQDRDLRFTAVHIARVARSSDAASEQLGRTEAELLRPAAGPGLMLAKRAVIDTGTGARIDDAIETDGVTEYHDNIVEPLLDRDGHVAGLVTVSVDVTARRLAEAEQQRALQRLVDAESVARTGSWEWDIAADQVRWSAGLFAIYGIEPGDPPVRDQPSPERIHPEDRDRIDASIRRALATGAPIEIDSRIVRADGRIRLLHGRGEIIADDNGRPVRMTATVQDVTDARQAEHALQQTAAELTRRAGELQRLGRNNVRSGSDLERVLSERRREILALVADGLTNADIATRLFLAESTVKWHMGKILRRLGVTNRAQAIARHLAAGPEA